MQIINTALYYIQSAFAILTGFEKPFSVVKLFLNQDKKTQKEGNQVRLKRQGIQFTVRTAMDMWSIKETFLDDFYRFEASKKPVKGTIIDIGAGIGEFAIQAAAACPDGVVYGFEPFPESYQLFQKNIKDNSLTNIHPIEAAVSSIPGAMVMDTSSGNPLQFRMQPGVHSQSAIKTVMLIDFLNENGISQCDLLKLDCEGGEYDILLPLSQQELGRFQRIVMEYHDALTPHNHKELVEHIKNGGFNVEVVQNVVHDELGYIYAQRP
ncbi:MAG TPA: FkbM family methyltransferase [Leptolinea sp.]